MEDSFDLPNDVLESSLTSTNNDYLQTDVTDISVEGQSPQVSCEMCKKMKKNHHVTTEKMGIRTRFEVP